MIESVEQVKKIKVTDLDPGGHVLVSVYGQEITDYKVRHNSNHVKITQPSGWFDILAYDETVMVKK